MIYFSVFFIFQDQLISGSRCFRRTVYDAILHKIRISFLDKVDDNQFAHSNIFSVMAFSMIVTNIIDLWSGDQ